MSCKAVWMGSSYPLHRYINWFIFMFPNGFKSLMLSEVTRNGLILRATLMNYGAWLYIHRSTSSSPAVLTNTCACGTRTPISPSGPNQWRWATHITAPSLLRGCYSSCIRFLFLESLCFCVYNDKLAGLSCVDRMSDWACVCFPHGQDAAQSSGFHPSGVTVAIGTQTGR